MADPRPGGLYLPRPCLRAIREHATAAWPHEGCGLLEGQAIGRATHVRRVVPCRNGHERPERRYRIDPELFLRADRAAESAGRRIVGVWHSHPHGDAYFSTTDRAEAWPDWSYVVAAVTAAGRVELACWRVHQGTLVQVPVRPER